MGVGCDGVGGWEADDTVASLDLAHATDFRGRGFVVVGGDGTFAVVV